ncbi:RNA polymerase II-associated protein 3 [Carex littledalei]|uniref:RNA polymerase II-associated protein 3 n=1 Tax=Carex littledalei TaxID=544730 RepID=A0A833R2T2_9POAL|nr:RNA polymerase II-associated protein 3 [Carex littledalei]
MTHQHRPRNYYPGHEDRAARMNPLQIRVLSCASQNLTASSPFLLDQTLAASSPSIPTELLLNEAKEVQEGNEYFKQKKFNEAIGCYSRSIGLTPTAVAFANRAMAYLKIKRQAETDCTEALNLDDRYVKAYSRRATARKELGKLKEAMEDAEFAVSIEPNTQELRKQYDDIKALYMKEMTKNISGTAKSSVPEVHKPSINAPEIAEVTSIMSSDARR